VARVLIVEDDADVRDWVAHCMLSDGHEIRGVPDRATLRRLRGDEPDYRPLCANDATGGTTMCVTFPTAD
jgi:hypothetical protein